MPAPVRPGYTLVELLIVLAVLGAVAAFTVPALRGPLDKSRLRAAARDVRAAMGKARATAIRSGAAAEFRCERDGRRWQVVLSRSPNLPDDPLRRRDEDSGANATTRSAAFGSDSESMAGIDEFSGRGASRRTVVLEGELPTGVRFFFPDPLYDPPEDATTDSYRASVRNAVPADPQFLADPKAGLADDAWQTVVTFRPNGRGSDAELLLSGQRRFAVRVRVRGLTSSATFGAPFRLDATVSGVDPESSTDLVKEGR